MGMSIKNWEEVCEYPSTKTSEISYIRHRHIDRISVIETEDDTFSVLIYALNDTYLHSVHDTDKVAIKTLEELVKTIEQ